MQVKYFKLTILFLLAALLIVAAGCQSGSGGNEQQKAGESTPQAGTDQPAQVDFPKKDITFIVPVSPGGGFDTTVRMLAPYLEKHLPKKVNVIVDNVPGGEWNVGISKLNRAAPDGHTIGIFNIPGNVVNQILGNAQYDLNKFSWIGNISITTYVAAVSPDSPYQSLEAMQKAAEVKIATVGLSSTGGLGQYLAAEKMGIKTKMINHDGSNESILSAIRGDSDWVQFPFATLKKHIVDAKDLNPLWVYSQERLPELPDVPTVVELGYPELLDIVSMYRPVAAPPNMPPDIAKVLVDSFQKAINDPEFVAKIQESGDSPSPMSAKETTDVISRSVKEFTPYKQVLEDARK